jgi:hypothetical protein
MTRALRDFRERPGSGGVALQLPISIEEPFDQGRGQAPSLSDVNPLAKGPGSYRGWAGQILLDNVGGKPASLTDDKPAAIRPFPNCRRLSEV